MRHLFDKVATVLTEQQFKVLLRTLLSDDTQSSKMSTNSAVGKVVARGFVLLLDGVENSSSLLFG